jgi:hypothetical protein
MGLPASKCDAICDERTYNLCSSEFEFADLGQVVVKGKAMPINIYNPLKRKENEKSDDENRQTFTMVGRTAEKHEVQEVLSKHSRGGAINCTILVEGEGGQGVSTFGRFIKFAAENLDYIFWYDFSVLSFLFYLLYRS